MTAIMKRTWVNRHGEPREGYRVGFMFEGKKRFKQFKRRKEAAEFVHNLTAWKEGCARGHYSPTLDEATHEWITACRVGRNGANPLEPETLRGYENLVKNHIAPVFGTEKIGNITRQHLMAFRDETVQRCRSRTMARKIMVTLHGIFQHAVDQGRLSSNPCEGVTVRAGGRHAKQIEIPSKAEMSLALAKAAELRQSTDQRVALAWQRYAPLLHTLVYTGMRFGEVRGLRRRDVDLDAGVITVAQRADRVGRIGPPKTKRGRRRIHIPPHLVDMLRVYLSTHNFDLVFASRNGDPLFPENTRKRMWKHVLELIGAKDYPIHAIRHFFASRQIEGGANAKEVATLLGHADEGFTLRVYGHLFHDAESEQRRRDRAAALVLTT